MWIKKSIATIAKHTKTLIVFCLCPYYSMCEDHLKIASRIDVLEQFVSIAHSPSYNTWWAQLAVSAFVCFVQNSEGIVIRGGVNGRD